VFIRKLLIRTSLPLLWRTSSRRTAAGLQRFAVAEAESAWQLLNVLDSVDEPKLRARVFQHALEEFHHSSEFDRVARPYCEALPPRPLPERDPLYDPADGEEGLAKFMAYAHVGELEVFGQFDAYAAGIGPCDAREVFKSAKKDELGHVGLTRHLFVSMSGESAVGMAVMKARFQRLYETWLRFSRGFGEIPSAILLGTIYLLSAPLLALPCRARLADSYTHANPGTRS